MDGPLRRPTVQDLRAGTPSDSEVPRDGARALWLLSRFSKVTRCKSATNISHEHGNGYVHKTSSDRPRGLQKSSIPLQIRRNGDITQRIRTFALPRMVLTNLIHIREDLSHRQVQTGRDFLIKIRAVVDRTRKPR